MESTGGGIGGSICLYHIIIGWDGKGAIAVPL